MSIKEPLKTVLRKYCHVECYDPKLINALHESEVNGNTTKFYLIYFGLTVVLLGVFVFFVWLFYRLIYGLLLKRLKRNYEELKKLDF